MYVYSFSRIHVNLNRFTNGRFCNAEAAVCKCLILRCGRTTNSTPLLERGAQCAVCAAHGVTQCTRSLTWGAVWPRAVPISWLALLLTPKPLQGMVGRSSVRLNGVGHSQVF